jgi:hypothetical protein
MFICLIFPPLWPVAVLWYLMGGRNASRATTQAVNNAAARADRRAQEAALIQFAAMTDEQQRRVTQTLQQARRLAIKRRLQAWGFVIVCIAAWAFYRWLNGPYPEN